MVHARQHGVHKEKLWIWIYAETGRHLGTLKVTEDGKLDVAFPNDVNIERVKWLPPTGVLKRE